ncbi:hypothetical protein ACOSQ4_032450 [Xanthoceras sorbifolium]
MKELRQGLVRANQELAQGEEHWREEILVVTDEALHDLLYNIWLHHPNLPLGFLSEGLLALLKLPTMITMLETGTMAWVETFCLAGFGASLPEVMVKLNHLSQQFLRV